MPGQAEHEALDSSFSAAASTGDDRARTPDLDPVKLFADHKASIVQLRVANKQVASEPLTDSIGTGFFISNDGAELGSCVLVSDHHVIERAAGPVHVVLASGQTIDARVEVDDAANDLAILKISNVIMPSTNCRPLAIASGMVLSRGDQVMAMSAEDGTAAMRLGEALSVNSRRAFVNLAVDNGEDLDRRLMLLSMSSKRGDSGGPVLNSRGLVVDVVLAGGGTATAATPSFYLLVDIIKSGEKYFSEPVS